MRGRFVAYYRVSTQEQGKSGLGLEAQRKAVVDYLDGGKWELLAEFTEVESGMRDDRPELAKAIAMCKRAKARLVIAKLDRLSRDVAFIATLMKGVDFLAVDNPHANKLTVHIMAAMAEHERDAISQRTKDALASARARGVKLGDYERIAAGRRKATAARAESVRQPIAETLHLSAAAAATQLNRRNIASVTGKRWQATQIIRARKRLGQSVEPVPGA
jgi:DNA invertase Pin-like site-specific DNA recombinase